MAIAKRPAGELARQQPFEYAPAPEATDHVRIAGVLAGLQRATPALV